MFSTHNPYIRCGSIDQRCGNGSIDQRCTSENIDQRCESVEQKCNGNGNNNNNNNNVIQTNLTMLKAKNLLDIHIDDYDIIAVDESHFFTDLREFVKRALLSNKSLIVAGLIADSRGEKFGQTLDLVPICTDIVRLKAYCSLCAKSSVYRVASHSKCILKADEVMLIGGADKYIPVCREHYNLLLV
jgi:thymidine kinase